jgi:hypothetical protein
MKPYEVSSDGLRSSGRVLVVFLVIVLDNPLGTLGHE